MAGINVLAGDFAEGRESGFLFGSFTMAGREAGFLGHRIEAIPAADVDAVELASEESVKRLWGTVAAGAVGAVALGPLGLLAGVLVGGNRRTVTFVCRFRDGRKFLGETDPKTWKKILAATF